jgi:transposase
MQIRSIGIDLGKTTFHLVALGDYGKVLLKKKFTQKGLIAFTANLQTSLIGVEACSGAHFLGRTLRDEADPGSVREAVCEVQQERLH